MRSKGIEHKTHMEAYEKENREGKLGLINGKFEHMIETASKVAGLTRKQYKEWREMEKLEENLRNPRSTAPNENETHAIQMSRTQSTHGGI